MNLLEETELVNLSFGKLNYKLWCPILLSSFFSLLSKRHFIIIQLKPKSNGPHFQYTFTKISKGFAR